MEFRQFMKDTKTQDAVVRNLEIIGEAAKNMSDDLKNRYPKMPWKDFARVRDKLIHFYFGVNLDVVWDIVKNELPPAFKSIKSILQSKAD